MGVQSTTQDALTPFTLERVEPVQVRQVSLIPRKRDLKRKKLGKFSDQGREVQVWLEGGVVRFRRKHKRRVESVSLIDIYHHAMGQKELAL